MSLQHDVNPSVGIQEQTYIG